MPENWINGNKPLGLLDENILVIGPDNFDDEPHVKLVLDEYTIRMEAVRIILDGIGNSGKHRGKGFKYEGVCCQAYEWAIKQFWPIELHDPGWWGSWWGYQRKPARREPRAKKAYRKMDAVILERLLASGKEHAHVIAFWDRECERTEELMEMSREVVSMRNYTIVRV